MAWADDQPWCSGDGRLPAGCGWHSEGDVWTHTKMVCAQLPQLEDWPTLTAARADGPHLHGPVPRLREAAHVAGRSRLRAGSRRPSTPSRGASLPVGPAGPGMRPGDPRRDRPAGPVPRPSGVPPRKAGPGPRGRLALLAGQQQAALPVRPRRHPRPQDGRDGASRGEPALLEARRRGERLLRAALSVRQRPRPVPVLPADGAESPLRPVRGLPLHGDDDVGPARQRARTPGWRRTAPISPWLRRLRWATDVRSST